jgi:hypothetical protein
MHGSHVLHIGPHGLHGSHGCGHGLGHGGIHGTHGFLRPNMSVFIVIEGGWMVPGEWGRTTIGGRLMGQAGIEGTLIAGGWMGHGLGGLTTIGLG